MRAKVHFTMRTLINVHRKIPITGLTEQPKADVIKQPTTTKPFNKQHSDQSLDFDSAPPFSFVKAASEQNSGICASHLICGNPLATLKEFSHRDYLWARAKSSQTE